MWYEYVSRVPYLAKQASNGRRMRVPLGHLLNGIPQEPKRPPEPKIPEIRKPVVGDDLRHQSSHRLVCGHSIWPRLVSSQTVEFAGQKRLLPSTNAGPAGCNHLSGRRPRLTSIQRQNRKQASDQIHSICLLGSFPEPLALDVRQLNGTVNLQMAFVLDGVCGLVAQTPSQGGHTCRSPNTQVID